MRNEWLSLLLFSYFQREPVINDIQQLDYRWHPLGLCFQDVSKVLVIHRYPECSWWWLTTSNFMLHSMFLSWPSSTSQNFIWMLLHIHAVNAILVKLISVWYGIIVAMFQHKDHISRYTLPGLKTVPLNWYRYDENSSSSEARHHLYIEAAAIKADCVSSFIFPCACHIPARCRSLSSLIIHMQ